MPKFFGVLAAGLYILAWMIVWGFLIRLYVATREPGEKAAAPAKGAAFSVG